MLHSWTRPSSPNKKEAQERPRVSHHPQEEETEEVHYSRRRRICPLHG